ncbi:SDR family oxidoreductase [Phenylobacterium aquaticum]|uniref:SDR family oxidoreductase n=1 Tax=Phenylobacterium aquaticum TaxID=1763816 RepID=UPI001F5DC6B7|nr:SDR family oxidoreductase [Phenylobacterium aquaticum]MCI3134716.1 SDR family oxidoreductase [Phenylobacterium aquaticum]
MRILVTGAYGLIGGRVTARLLAEGHEVTGVGRHVAAAARSLPQVRWIEADLARWREGDWAPHLADIDAVVNCAGALQDGPTDNLVAVHLTGPLSLGRACVTAGVRRFVQISAAGVAHGQDAFSRTKREGDEALAGLDLDWTILRPALVLAPVAYGGSALLRALAAVPFVIPAVHARAVTQVVAVDDIALAVARALAPDAPMRRIIDLGASAETTLAEVLIGLRAWLGLPPAPVLDLPPLVARIAATGADALAWLGWRSPLRSATLGQLARGVRIRPGEAERALGFAPKDLSQALAAMPAGVQERWFARLYALKPVILAGLAGFWIVSGAVGLAEIPAATAVLAASHFPPAAATPAVIGGALADIALGLLACVRSTAAFALWGMILVTGGYMVGATLWRPDLWADPMGPLVKTLPAALLALVALALLEDR